jgi:hypothetical protein
MLVSSRPRVGPRIAKSADERNFCMENFISGLDRSAMVKIRPYAGAYILLAQITPKVLPGPWLM